MATCDRCGTEARAQARYCPKCGRALATSPTTAAVAAEHPAAVQGPPPTADRPDGPPVAVWSTTSLVAVAVVVLLVFGGAGAATWYLAGRADEQPSTGLGQVPAPTTQPAAPTAQPAAPAASGRADAASVLDGQADADRAKARAVLDRWVPQLASKSVGMVVAGVAYDADAILALYRDLRARYGDVLLVRSSDYPSFQRGGLWVVLADVPSDDPGAANQWCDQRGIGKDDCFAKRLSETRGPEGSTVHR